MDCSDGADMLIETIKVEPSGDHSTGLGDQQPSLADTALKAQDQRAAMPSATHGTPIDKRDS